MEKRREVGVRPRCNPPSAGKLAGWPSLPGDAPTTRRRPGTLGLLSLAPLILALGCGKDASPPATVVVTASSFALSPGCTGSPSEVPGAPIWAQRYGDAKSQHGRQVAITPAGDLLVTGQFFGDIALGGTTLVNLGGEDAWLGKLDAAGAPIWGLQWGSAAAPPLYTYGLTLASDPSGNIFLGGQLTGDADLGGGSFTSAGSDDIFITKRDANGAHLWSKRYGDAAAQYILGLASDASGDLFVVGYFAGTIDWGTGPLTSAGSFDIYIAKLDGATGDGVWAHRYGDGSVQNAWALGVDASGGVTFVGNFSGTVDFGGGPVQSPGASDFDAFAVQLDAAGNYVWSRTFGGAGTTSLSSMALDGAGNVLLGGSFQGTLNMGGTPLTASNLDDAFLAKLDPAGNTAWSLAFPGNDFQRVVDIAADSAGNVAIAGRLKGDANFGGGVLTSAGDEDLFIAEYSPSGAYLFSARYGDYQAQTATALAIDANDNLIVTGGLYGSMDLGAGPLVSAGNRDVFIASIAGVRCLDACAGQADGAPCDDGDACTVGDTCQAGACVSGGGCDDGNACTDDACDPVNGCLYVDNTLPCDDGDACTLGDVCQAGVCAGAGQGDPDGDGVCSEVDNCPNDYNPSQVDSNANGVGDACTAVCLSIQRGVSGTWADNGVRSGTPDTSYGAASDALAGTLSGSTGYPLLFADLSGLPSGAHLTSASLLTAVTSNTAATLEVHRITAPWVEATTTWNTFASAFDPAVWASASNGGPVTTGPVSFDVLPLVQAFYDGTFANEGLLLLQVGGTNTKVFTGENTNLALRPSLAVCYTLPEAAPFCALHPDGTACDDGDACTPNDTCSGGLCVGSPGPSCDDGNGCTDDACDPATGACVYANNTTPCDDGDVCTAADTCQGGACVGIASGDVDGDALCASLDNCPTTYNPSQADGNADGVGDACTPTCVVIQRGIFGTLEDTGVRSASPTTTYGTATDVLAGTLGGGAGYPLLRADLGVLPAGVQLTSANLTTALTATTVAPLEIRRITAPWVEATTTWNSFGLAFDATVWASASNGAPITLGPVSFDVLALVQAWYGGTYPNHGLLINQVGGASTKVSTGETVNPVYRPALTICYNIPETACAAKPDGTACDDGDACTQTDACMNGECVGSSAVSCDDANACTDDSCDPVSGNCVNLNNVLPCDDGDACTQGEACAAGVCAGGAAVSCDDANACTDDVCDNALGCVHTDNALACDDGDPCTLGDTCQGGACSGTPQAGNCGPCSVPGSDGVPCNDGIACTENDVCAQGVCGGVANDTDADGICDAIDNCPATYNPLQHDVDIDGVGDSCSILCQTFQRGVQGTVVDTTVSSGAPTTPVGLGPSFKSATLGGSTAYGLVRVDLASLPATAQVVSSILSVEQSSSYAVPVNLHRITSSWLETVDTWNSFGSAFSPIIEATVTTAPPSSTMAFDITTLTQAWRSLALPNYGVLLEQAQGQTVYVASDSPSIPSRPQLTVCYIIPDNSCVNGDVCDDGDSCTTNDICAGGVCTGDPSSDSDGDGVCDAVDNCYDVANTSQLDTNGDGTGDACANCTDVAAANAVAASLAQRVVCNDDALTSGSGACGAPLPPSCAGSLVEDAVALAYGGNNPAFSAVDPLGMVAQLACQTAIGSAVVGYVNTKLYELEVGSDEASAEAAAIGNLAPILTSCNVPVVQDPSGVVLPSVGPQCAPAIGAIGTTVDPDMLRGCLHTLLDVWVQRFGPSPQPLRPNILLIMVDDMRWDEVGPTHTPMGDNLPLTLQEIQDQGIQLTNAYATTPLCCPSRSTVLTGAYAHTHGVVDNGTVTPVAGGASAFPDASTLATTLQAAGYRTGLAGKYLNNYNLLWTNVFAPYVPPGWDDWYGMKQHLYYNYKLVEKVQGGTPTEVVYASAASDYATDVIREKTKTFIQSAAASGQPFFFFTSFNAPHSPHPGAAPRHLGLFAGLAPWQPPNLNEVDVSDKPAWLRTNKPPISASGLQVIDDDRRDAGEMLLAVDEAIGGSVTYGITGIIDTLKAAGVYDNTMIIFMSDHGYFWAEHRLAGKPYVYQEDARIPLLIRYPRLIPLPRQDGSLAVTNDIAPTLIELAGAQPLPGSDGKSFVRVLDGTMHNGRSDFMIEGWSHNQEFAAVHDGRWKYVEYSPQAGGDFELYDLENDPYELTSIHADPQQTSRIQAMHARLMQIRPNWPADAP